MSIIALLLTLVLYFSSVESQVYPTKYTFPKPTSVNGSSATGNCANVSSSTSGTLTCADPFSSVLFDDPRGMPILTGLGGDMWASQLLTIQTTASSIDIIVDLNTPTFIRVERVEMVMFNCPQWGIGVQTIQPIEQKPLINFNEMAYNLTTTSCDSLVRLCLPYRTTVPVFTLQFFLSPGSDWVHLGEVSFWGNSRACPPDTLPPQPPTSPITSTSQGSPITSTSQGSPIFSTIQPSPVTTSEASLPTTENTSSQLTLTSNTVLTSDAVTMELPTLFPSASTSSQGLAATATLPNTPLPLETVTMESPPHFPTTPVANTKRLPATSTVTSPNTALTSETATTEPKSLGITVIVIALAVSLLFLMLVAVVVVVLVLWRCRHQHSAKEEASHIISQTHTHPVVSLFEERGQVQHVSEQQDTDQDNPSNLYSSLNLQAEKEGTHTRKNQYDDVEMHEYSVLHHGAQHQKSGKKHEGGQAEQFQEYSTLNHGKTPVQNAAGTEDTSFYDKIDQKYQVEKQNAKGGGDDQLYSRLDMASTEVQTQADQLYAQVDKKKKGKKKSKEDKIPTGSPETAVDQLYAQVDKNKQKSKEKEVCPEESGAVYSVVNKPMRPAPFR